MDAWDGEGNPYGYAPGYARGHEDGHGYVLGGLDEYGAGAGSHGYDPEPDDELERDFAQLLAQFDAMRDPAGRQAVFRSLGRRVTNVLASAPRSSRMQEDLLGMVQAAADHPGGLRLLLHTIGAAYQGTKAWMEADRFLRVNYPEPLLTPEERDQLLILLRNVAHSNIEDLLRFALDHDESFGERLAGRRDQRRARSRPVESDLTALVAVLEDSPNVPGQVHPLTVFVESAAAPEDTYLRDKLRSWNGRLTGRQDWPVQQMLEVRSRASIEAGRAPEESCLLIEINSPPCAPEVYDVTAWLCRAGGTPGRLQATLRAHTQAEVDQCVNTVHDQASTALAVLAPGMRVEFLLPWHLIWLPVDQIVIRPRGRIGRTLGSHRSVVVRSAERHHSPEWHAALYKRWNWLKNHTVDDAEGAVRWVGPQERIDPETLFGELNQAAEIPAVFVLLEPPSHTSNDHLGYFPVLMEMGIPVVLAVRRTASEDEARQRIETCLRGALKDLPERVWDLRRKSGAGESKGRQADTLDLHRHVSLVWDSPEGLKRTKAALGQPKSRGDEA